MPKLSDKRVFMVLFGSPGVGKGTFGKMLSKEYKYEQIITGELLKKEYKSCLETMSKGLLISDDILIKLVSDKLSSSSVNVILDGFPRTKSQAEYLLNIASSLDSHILTVNLTLNKTHLTSRLLGRRICTMCNRVYNVSSIKDGEYDMDPLLPTEEDLKKCKGCSDLKVRSDDTITVIEERLKIYQENYNQISELLSKNPLINFEIKRGVSDFPALKSIIDTYLSQNTRAPIN